MEREREVSFFFCWCWRVFWDALLLFAVLLYSQRCLNFGFWCQYGYIPARISKRGSSWSGRRGGAASQLDGRYHFYRLVPPFFLFWKREREAERRGEGCLLLSCASRLFISSAFFSGFPLRASQHSALSLSLSIFF